MQSTHEQSCFDSVDLDAVEMPKIDLSQIPLPFNAMKLAESIIDDQGRLRETAPTLDSSPELTAATLPLAEFLWQQVAIRLSPKLDHARLLFAFGRCQLIEGDQNVRAFVEEQLIELATRIYRSVPPEQRYGLIRFGRAGLTRLFM